MGYSYGYNPRSRRYDLLSCDSCGLTTADGARSVRKRTCPHKVLTDSHRSWDGRRHALPYCYPSALCSGCYAKHKDGLHSDCARRAAESNADYDRIEALLDAGEKLVASAIRVEDGKTRVTFTGRAGTGEVNALVDSEDYNPHTRKRLSDYPNALVLEGTS